MVEKSKVTERCSHTQQVDLLARMVRARRNLKDRAASFKIADPPYIARIRKRIKALEKIVLKQDNLSAKERSRLYRVIDAAELKIREQILFGSAVEALQAVKDFERGNY